MSSDLAELSQQYPFAYHVTGKLNLESMKASRTLRSTEHLLAGTPHAHLLKGPRVRSERIVVDGHTIELRPQGGLNEANSQLLDDLNSRVSLWAGDEQGPPAGFRGPNEAEAGKAGDDLIIIKFSMSDLLAANPGRPGQIPAPPPEKNEDEAASFDGVPYYTWTPSFYYYDYAYFPNYWYYAPYWGDPYQWQYWVW